VDRTNVLVIMADQHNASFMSARGGQVETPNLDALASRGIMFENAYGACPLCTPSRAGFMTCRYPHEVGAANFWHALDSNIPTFAHASAIAGYESTLVGRMHFYGLDQHHGFTKRLVGDIAPMAHLGRGWDLGPFSNTAGSEPSAIRNSGAGQTTVMKYDETVTLAAIEELEVYSARRHEDDAKPLMMVVGLYGPHAPYRAPRESFDRYAGNVTLPERTSLEASSDYVRHYYNSVGLGEVTEDDERRALAAYCALVSEVDARVGRILEALDETGLAENTIVVYTGDHGDHAGAHHLWWKHSFYEDSIRVPLIVAGPGVDVGRRVEEPVSLIDVGATAIDLADAPPVPEMTGESLRPFFTDPDAKRSQPVMADQDASPYRWIRTSRMVRDGRWKYIWYHDPEIGDELYDLDTDPGECRNLAGNANHREVRDRLHAKLFEDGWDPERITANSAAMWDRLRYLASWTREVKPDWPWYYEIDPEVNVPQ